MHLCAEHEPVGSPGGCGCVCERHRCARLRRHRPVCRQLPGGGVHPHCGRHVHCGCVVPLPHLSQPAVHVGGQRQRGIPVCQHRAGGLHPECGHSAGGDAGPGDCLRAQRQRQRLTKQRDCRPGRRQRHAHRRPGLPGPVWGHHDAALRARLQREAGHPVCCSDCRPAAAATTPASPTLPAPPPCAAQPAAVDAAHAACACDGPGEGAAHGQRRHAGAPGVRLHLWHRLPVCPLLHPPGPGPQRGGPAAGAGQPAE